MDAGDKRGRDRERDQKINMKSKEWEKTIHLEEQKWLLGRQRRKSRKACKPSVRK